MRWRSVKFRPAQACQCTRSGAKLNHSFSVHHAGLVVDLDLQRAPVGQVLVVEPARIAGDHHRTGQRLQDAEKRDMVGVRVVEAVAALRPARRLHVGRVAVDQFVTLEVEVGQERVGRSRDGVSTG